MEAQAQSLSPKSPSPVHKEEGQPIFHVYKVTEEQKVRLASLVFLDYANQWWHHLVLDIGLNKRSHAVSWYDLKTCMRARFVLPSSKEHLLKFQRLHQGHRTVDEYFKDFETTLTKMNIVDYSRQVYRINCNIVLFKVRMSNPQRTILIKMFCYKTH